jgi:hypothetical protein
MIRTQIQLTEQQAEALKQAAARRGVSMAELIRQSIDQLLGKAGDLSQKDLRLRAGAVAGRFRSGRTDVSVHHDEHLAEALDQ